MFRSIAAGSRLAVQRRYNLNLFLSVLTGSLQGFAERPLPCSYNVIPSVIALSRRKRGFKSRRGRHLFNGLHHETSTLGSRNIAAAFA